MWLCIVIKQLHVLIDDAIVISVQSFVMICFSFLCWQLYTIWILFFVLILLYSLSFLATVQPKCSHMLPCSRCNVVCACKGIMMLPQGARIKIIYIQGVHVSMVQLEIWNPYYEKRLSEFFIVLFPQCQKPGSKSVFGFISCRIEWCS